MDDSCFPERANNRFGSKADICTASAHVRFTPNSDIDCVFRHVRFGPKADSCTAANSIAIRSPHPRSPAASAHREAECFGSPDVDEMLDGSVRHSGCDEASDTLDSSARVGFTLLDRP